jgi:hypothetical protein
MRALASSSAVLRRLVIGCPLVGHSNSINLLLLPQGEKTTSREKYHNFFGFVFPFPMASAPVSRN